MTASSLTSLASWKHYHLRHWRWESVIICVIGIVKASSFTSLAFWKCHHLRHWRCESVNSYVIGVLKVSSFCHWCHKSVIICVIGVVKASSLYVMDTIKVPEIKEKTILHLLLLLWPANFKSAFDQLPITKNLASYIYIDSKFTTNLDLYKWGIRSGSFDAIFTTTEKSLGILRQYSLVLRT